MATLGAENRSFTLFFERARCLFMSLASNVALTFSRLGTTSCPHSFTGPIPVNNTSQKPEIAISRDQGFFGVRIGHDTLSRMLSTLCHDPTGVNIVELANFVHLNLSDQLDYLGNQTAWSDIINFDPKNLLVGITHFTDQLVIDALGKDEVRIITDKKGDPHIQELLLDAQGLEKVTSLLTSVTRRLNSPEYSNLTSIFGYLEHLSTTKPNIELRDLRVLTLLDYWLNRMEIGWKLGKREAVTYTKKELEHVIETIKQS